MMINSPYQMYMMEQEIDYLKTREQKIDKIIKDIKNFFEKNQISLMSNATFNVIVKSNGMDPNELTNYELKKIQKAIF